MNTKRSARPCSANAPPNRMVRAVGGSGLAGAAAAALLLAAGVALPVLGQPLEPNRLELCTLSGITVTGLQNDIDTDVVVDGVPEVAFVVVYSINNDNNGQPIPGGTTGPVLCTNPTVVGDPFETPADTDILGIDILDSAEAFLLRFEGSGGTTEPETRFCHTTNANVDCYLLGPPPAGE